MRHQTTCFKALAVAASLAVTTPVFANPAVLARAQVTPDDALYALEQKGNWSYSPSIWDGRVGGNRRPWAWTMKIDYNVTKSGRVGYCNVTHSSGNDSFDQAACSALTRNVRVTPTVDEKGRPKLNKQSLDYHLYYRPAWICGTGLDELEEPQ